MQTSTPLLHPQASFQVMPVVLRGATDTRRGWAANRYLEQSLLARK